MSENQLENKLSLKDFSPKLRKIALVIAESSEPMSIYKACQVADVPYEAVKKAIQRLRQKGIDFNRFLHSESLQYIWNNIPAIDRKVVDQAISGSHKAQELAYRRVGLFKDSPLVQIDNRSLTVVASPSVAVPNSIRKSLPEEDVNELEIEGPK